MEERNPDESGGGEMRALVLALAPSYFISSVLLTCQRTTHFHRSIKLIKGTMEERNPVADDEGRQVCRKREREGESASAPPLQLFRQLLRKDFGNSRDS